MSAIKTIKADSSPSISIVTPSYNQAEFLEATIRSVLDQNYPNLEYIVMDGGSTDGSVDIIRKYEKELTGWVSEKDNGQTDAINRGFSKCTGDILNWINSDDRLKPGTLSSLVEMVKQNPGAGAWVGACDRVGPSGKLLSTVKPRGLSRDLMADWGSAGHFFQPSCFISREAWERFGPIDESLEFVFDFNLYMKIIAEMDFCGTDTVWTEATIHKEAKTQAQIPLLRAERYLVQARHGYESLAKKSIAEAETIALSVKGVPEPPGTVTKLLFPLGRLFSRSKGGAAPMIVFGYPKSGNTWLSYLLANALNVPFDKMAEPGVHPRNEWQRKLVKGGLPHRSFKDLVGGIWGTHELSDYKKHTDKSFTIYLVRDGRDAMVSYFYYLNKCVPAEQMKGNKSTPRDEEAAFTAFLKKHAGKWAKHVNADLKTAPGMIVRYEDLHSDPNGMLKKIFVKMGTDITDEVISSAVENFSFKKLSGRDRGEGDNKNFFRKGVVGDWKNLFTEEQKELFKKLAGKELILYGYEKDNNW